MSTGTNRDYFFYDVSHTVVSFPYSPMNLPLGFSRDLNFVKLLLALCSTVRTYIIQVLYVLLHKVILSGVPMSESCGGCPPAGSRFIVHNIMNYDTVL